ncbi:MAG: carbohydrate binding family 9 domain-containing protein [Lewinellaceae bacterium]|nr:carbohydrate binding family 9 domain-containing protein [Lewinellaceae bacterium]
MKQLLPNTRSSYLCVLLFCGASICLPAQTSYNVQAKNLERPSAAATAVEALPVIDGEVLEDPVWQSITPLTDMWQLQPRYGQPGSEKTEIRIAYTAEMFLLSVVCYDAKPGSLVISDARRDAALDNTDSFLFILDTYHDGQNGFVFGTNSQGVEYDAQINNEGQGNNNPNRNQGGQIGGVNVNWDASWEVKSHVGEFGWSAEFAIPLRTLRFTSGQNQIWGINFQRNIRKTNEINYWALLPIQFDLNRLSLAGTLTNLNLTNQGNLKVIPYALGQISRNFQNPDSKSNLATEVGTDVKYSITPALTLDLTYNTDFAQVEVDDQQINLDRFNLFFPEKRPFFLENAGLFSVGSPGEVDLFFSRRIGIGAGGRIVPIVGGARLSGRLNHTNVGFLSMFTEGVSDAGVDPNNFSAVRVSHEFAPRSAIGGIFVNRQGTGGDQEDNYNRTMAVDGRLGIGKKAQISGFYAKTATPGITDQDQAFKLQTNYQWNGLEVNLAYTEVGEGFNPETGFLLRNTFRKPEFLVLQRIRPNGKFGLLELRPHVSYRSYRNFDGFLQTSFLHVDNHWEFQSGFEVHTGINFTTEGVAEAFEISPGVMVPAGTYEHREGQFVILTNQSKVISFSTRHVLGGFFGGTRLANNVTMYVRLGDRFNSEFTINNNDISLPGGDFTATILRARLAYSFTPRIFTQSLIQYNNVADIWSANIRFGWLQQANTGLFLVFNEIRGNGQVNNRSLTLKYTRVFDVIK